MRMSVKAEEVKIGDTIIINDSYFEEYRYVSNVRDGKGLFDEKRKIFTVYDGYVSDDIYIDYNDKLEILRNVSDDEMEMPESKFFEWYLCSSYYEDNFPRFEDAKFQSEYGMSCYEYIREQDVCFLEDCKEFWKYLNSKDYRSLYTRSFLINKYIEDLQDTLRATQNQISFFIADINRYNSK